MVRVLHSSDWHLGVHLYEKDRLEEQKQFLLWLGRTIAEEKIHVLVVSGDIFDSYAPSVEAQTLYYEFLAGLLALGPSRPEIFIIAGNHDSPQFLNAPKEILSHLRIHIVSGINAGKTGPYSSCIFEIRDEKNNPVLAVCAVPFLRERDLKLIADPGAGDDPAAMYREAAAAYYRSAVEEARKRMPGIPLLATGHLFLGGSVLSDEDSERFREVGKLSSMPADLLPKADYYALGHLHRAQCIGGNECMRYAGSPIAMSFSEAGQSKSVVIVEFESAAGQYDFFRSAGPQITIKEIPQWQKLERIRGDAQAIRKRLEEIKEADENVLIDIQVTSGSGSANELWAEIDAIRSDALEKRLRFSILAKQDMRKAAQGADLSSFTEVASLKPLDVFEQKLNAEGIEGEERTLFTVLFREIEIQVHSGGAEEEAEGGKTE